MNIIYVKDIRRIHVHIFFWWWLETTPFDCNWIIRSMGQRLNRRKKKKRKKEYTCTFSFLLLRSTILTLNTLTHYVESLDTILLPRSLNPTIGSNVGISRIRPIPIGIDRIPGDGILSECIGQWSRSDPEIVNRWNPTLGYRSDPKNVNRPNPRFNIQLA